MMNVELKYGSGYLTLSVPDEQLIGIYRPMDLPGVDNLDKAVRQSLAKPVGSKRLEQIVGPNHKVAIVVDDATRAVPSAQLLTPIVDVLKQAGVSDSNICVIVATGLHRPMTEPELDKVLGNLEGRIRIINHNSKSDLKYVGRTPLGTDISINKTFMEADVKILTGDVEFHQFCGYGGGAKSVHPGLADSDSICITHSRMELDGTGPGRIDGNPVREDIDAVGRLVGVDFIVNVVINQHKQVVNVFSGDMMAAFREGAKVCDSLYKVEVPHRADVVIASAGGFPKDIELYQAQKAIQSAVRVVKKGGKIILVAECREGHGSDLAYKWAKESKTIDDIFVRIKERFTMGGHKAYQLAMAAKWADIYLYSAIEPFVVEEFFLHPLTDVGQIERLINGENKVAVFPQATLTVAKVKGESELGFGLPKTEDVSVPS
jgi:nickel-dependent lactate racemase